MTTAVPTATQDGQGANADPYDSHDGEHGAEPKGSEAGAAGRRRRRRRGEQDSHLRVPHCNGRRCSGRRHADETLGAPLPRCCHGCARGHGPHRRRVQPKGDIEVGLAREHGVVRLANARHNRGSLGHRGEGVRRRTARGHVVPGHVAVASDCRRRVSRRTAGRGVEGECFEAVPSRRKALGHCPHAERDLVRPVRPQQRAQGPDGGRHGADVAGAVADPAAEHWCCA